VGIEIDHPPDRSLGHKVAASDAEAADLDQACESGGGARPQPALPGLKINPIVANQNGPGNLIAAPGQNQFEGEPTFTRARRAAEQDGLLPD
jgi:hypothetical protein